MKKLNRILFALSFVAVFSCKPDKEKEEEPTPTVGMTELSGEIKSSMTLDASKKYLLKGNVYVMSPSKLTIPAGTVIFGDKASKGALIINRGAMIDAQGTATNPVVFTSNAPVGFRNRGDWGGVVILGKAANNAGTDASIEGITASTGENGKYGGSDNGDNSGTLAFCRIEFAGIALSPDNELNSLTLGSVGLGTTIHHIQVSYAGDDAFEWFGGSVNHKYLVATHTLDDDFDTDRGYTGSVQFGVVLRASGDADFSGSNAFEASSGTETSTPQSAPQFANVTVWGPLVFGTTFDADYKNAADINKFSNLKIYNSILGGFPTGIKMAGAGSGASLSGVLSVNNTALGAASEGVTAPTVVTMADLYGTEKPSLSQPTPVLVGTSAYLAGAPALPANFEQVSYYGAFGGSASAEWAWTSGWLNFDPINKAY